MAEANPVPPALAGIVNKAEAAAVETREAVSRLVALMMSATSCFEAAVPPDGSDGWEMPWRAWGLEGLWAYVDELDDLMQRAADWLARGHALHP